MRQLRPYQANGVEFIKSRDHSGLFVDMGLGKTAITLHALLDLPRPVLVVGPIRVIETVWEAEAEEWLDCLPLSFQVVRGSPAERRKLMTNPAAVYLINPELLEWFLAEKGLKPKTLVIDESSMFKNPSSLRFRTLRKALPTFERRIILTGTPTPNSLLDLWSQIFILDRGERLGKSFTQYKHRFFRTTDYMGYNWEPVEGAFEEITRLVSDIILRVDSKTALPPRTVIDNVVRIALPGQAMKEYTNMEKNAFTKLLGGEVSAVNAAAVSMKLRQMASGFVYDEDKNTHPVHQAKIKATEEILEETGSPVILVYQFAHELEALRVAFPHGVKMSSEAVVPFNRGEIPLLFLHPQSGGHGLNLQKACHTMVIFSGSFSFDHMAQTKARIDRSGQEHTVVFHYLTATNTIDEVLLQVQQEKLDTQTAVLEAIKKYGDKKLKRQDHQ